VADEEPPHEAAPRSFLLQHLGLLAPAVALGFFAASLMRVARGNTVTALAILQAQSGVDLALAIALRLLPIVLFTLAAIAVWAVRSGRFQNRDEPLWILMLLVTLLVPVGQLLSMLLIILLATTPTIRWHYRRRKGKEVRNEAPFRKSGHFDGIIAVLLVIFLLPDTMWLPPEALTLNDDQSLVGYVLAESDAELRVLRESDRTVLAVDRVDVHDRQLCELRSLGWQGKSLFGLILDRNDANYARCAEEP
jgi:hypothetical protein